MSTESSPSASERSSKGTRKRVRKRRSALPNFMTLTREENTWSELLKSDRKFVVLVSALGILGLLALVLLPRVWRSSPEGVFPIMRVSGLDLLRVKLSTRQATAAMAKGDYAGAVEGWRGAIVSDTGAIDPKRRYLELCVLRGRPDPDPETLRFQLRESALLLHLGKTNLADVELVAAAAHAAEFRERTLGFLRLVPEERLSPAAQATLAACHFEGEDWPGFRSTAERFPGLTNELFQMQKAAVALIQRAPNPGGEWARLEVPAADLVVARAAARIRLVAAAQVGDEARFNEAWVFLERAQLLRPRDYVHRWRLLSRLGRATEATTSAMAMDLPVASTSEALLVVRELDRLGLGTKAVRVGLAVLERYRMDPQLWREVGRLMVRVGAPENLLGFVSDLRRLDPEDEPQPGFAAYCLGVAEHKLGHSTRADEAFGEAAADTALVRQSWLALECADTIRRLGYPERAERILQSVSDEQGMVPGFWARAQELAREARSESWLIEAARREYRADPKSPPVAGRYLEALLLNRTNAAEALALATSRQQDAGAEVAEKVSLSRAYLLQERWAEAAQTLAGITDQSLLQAGPELSARYQMAIGEALVELGQRKEAATILVHVDATQLFPGEVERLKLLRERAR